MSEWLGIQQHRNPSTCIDNEIYLKIKNGAKTASRTKSVSSTIDANRTNNTNRANIENSTDYVSIADVEDGAYSASGSTKVIGESVGDCALETNGAVGVDSTGGADNAEMRMA